MSKVQIEQIKQEPPISHTVGDAAAMLEKMFEEIDNEEEKQTGEEIRQEAVPENEIKETETDDGDKDVEETDDKITDESETPSPEAETEERSFETLTELAEAADMEFDDFMDGVKTQVTDNGKTLDVNLNELRNGYLRESDYTRKTQNLSEQRKAFESESEAKNISLNDRTIQLDGLITQTEQSLLGDYNAVNWEELREVDPGDYAAKRQDFVERQQRLANIKQDALNTFNNRIKEQEDKAKETGQDFRTKEREILLGIYPEWKDETKFQAETTEIRNYLKDSGFDENNLEALDDHRITVIARKAMQYDLLKKNGSVAVKKVKNLPKLVKPGAKQSKAQIQQGSRSERMGKLRKSGKVEDAADYLFNMLGE